MTKKKIELITRKYIEKYGEKGDKITLDELVNDEVIELFKDISTGLKEDVVNINNKIESLDNLILKLKKNK